MRIAFDAQPLIDNQKTGIGFCEAGFVRNITQKHPENQYELAFFCYRTEKEKSSRLAPMVIKNVSLLKCKWFPGALYRMLWSFIPVPYNWFFRSKADITHFFNYFIPPGVRRKKICTVHDMIYKAYPETVRFKTKIMLMLSLRSSCRRADRIITDSEFSKQEIIKYLKINDKKIIVIPCGVDPTVFFPNKNSKAILQIKQKYNIPKQYFLYLGTLEPRKNLVRLIEAYAILKNQLPDSPSLVLAGRKGWLYDSIFEKAKSLGLEDSVIFTGYIGDDEAPLLLNGAVAFLFPSIYEGFGMPPLEAMACGTPVLTSRAASLPEVVGDCALLVDPYDLNDIADNMLKLASDSSLRNELSRRGLERSKMFYWENISEQLYNVYEAVFSE